MSRKPRPDWTEITLHWPKRHRGLYCKGGKWSGTERHYVKQGEVWRCEQCYGRAWVCHEHWAMHQSEHAVRQLAHNGGPIE